MRNLDDADKARITSDLKGETPQVGMLKIQVAATIAMVTDTSYDDVIAAMRIAHDEIQTIAANL